MSPPTSHWPVRRMRNNDSLVVSDDRTTVSLVTWDKHADKYVVLDLLADVDPTDGERLVERREGVITRIAPARGDVWLLGAQWDPDSREAFGSYSAAVDYAQSRSST